MMNALPAEGGGAGSACADHTGQGADSKPGNSRIVWPLRSSPAASLQKKRDAALRPRPFISPCRIRSRATRDIFATTAVAIDATARLAGLPDEGTRGSADDTANGRTGNAV